MTKSEMVKKGSLEQADLDAVSRKALNTMQCRVRLVRPLAGGIPASKDGIAAFVHHHLNLAPGTAEAENAIARIMKEEVGERDITPEEGEVQEKEVYGINVIRRSPKGPFILEHQVKALIKQAATRIGVFSSKRGTKGDVIEMGVVQAHGISLVNEERPWEIYIRNGQGPATTHFVEMSGSVGTPQGKRSIKHFTEVTQEGAELEFVFTWPIGKLTREVMIEVMAAATRIKLGSCLRLGYGQFEVIKLKI